MPIGNVVVEPHAGDVVLHDLQDVIEIDRAEREAEHQAERADAERLDPDRPPDLAAQSADRLQHAELAPPIGDRHGQRVHDAEDRDEHGDGDLHRRQAEPLVGDLQNVALELRVRQHEHLRAARHSARESRCRTSGTVAPGFRYDAEDVHRSRRSSIAGTGVRSIEDRALLIRVVDDDADDRQADDAVRRRDLEHVAELQVLELREVVGRPSAPRRPRSRRYMSSAFAGDGRQLRGLAPCC